MQLKFKICPLSTRQKCSIKSMRQTVTHGDKSCQPAVWTRLGWTRPEIIFPKTCKICTYFAFFNLGTMIYDIEGQVEFQIFQCRSNFIVPSSLPLECLPRPQTTRRKTLWSKEASTIYTYINQQVSYI
jgi:hypothetical protein